MQDVEITIAEGKNKFATKWENRTMLWSEFVRQLSQKPIIRNMTVKNYHQADKEIQGKVKNVAGFVGGELIPTENGKMNRKKANFPTHSIATIDIDEMIDIPSFVEEYCFLFGNAAFIYSTLSSTEKRPRIRLLIPFSRPLKQCEYEEVMKQIFSLFPSICFDETSSEPNRLMYYPSVLKDNLEHFFVKEIQGDILDVDVFIKENQLEIIENHKIIKMEVPTEKNGVVGDFCRTYTVPQAIEKFLMHIYEEGTIPNRYTYKKGSSANGLIVYDEGMFATSHHDSDPISSRGSVNSFDLVRYHLYGSEDKDENSNPCQQPSFKKMLTLISNDEEIQSQKEQEALRDFEDIDIQKNQKFLANKFKKFNEVTEKSTEWLWYPYIPKGVITILLADPGVGKTNFSLYLASKVSSGSKFYGEDDLSGDREPGIVIIQNSEDPVDRVLKPRIKPMKPVEENIIFIDKDDLAFGDKIIDYAFEKFKPDLVIFDPIQSFLGSKVDAHRANETRPILNHLASLAEKYQTAVIIVSHMNKQSGASAIYRTLGSVDIVGIARSVLVFLNTNEEKTKKILTHEKSSLAIPGKSIEFHLDFDKEGIVFDGYSTKTADEILKQNREKTPRAKPALEDAKNFLISKLEFGEKIETKFILEEGKELEISESSLYRAKKDLCIRSENVGFGKDKKAFWFIMPGDPFYTSRSKF